MGDFDAINIFSKGINTMAIDLQGIKAAAAAQGGVEKADPEVAAVLARIEANKTVNPVAQGTVDLSGIQAAAAIQNANNPKTPEVIAQEEKTAAQLAAIDANKKVQADVPATVDKEGIAAAAAVQNANVVKDPAIVAQEEKNAAQLAAIDANRKVQADVPATVDKEGIAAAAAAQQQNEVAQAQKNIPVTTQQYDDGSKLETFADGSRVATDSEGKTTNSNAAKTPNPDTPNQTRGVATSVNAARATQAVTVSQNRIQKEDWRIRLSLAPGANYLYKSATQDSILYPLKGTNGIIFPYTPTIQTAYRASYESMDLVHTNYKMYFYKNSSVDEIVLTAEFTAQDTEEANYLLAVIHFFKSVTKMFYGQDGNNGPKAGTPPPLCYLNGYGQYQFNDHPVLISSFTYNLPNDVDYIRAGVPTVPAGTNTNSYKTKDNTANGKNLLSQLRTAANNLRKKQGTNKMSTDPKWINYANGQATYVPTKMQIQLSLLPIVTRNDISKNFSLEKYATGSLLKGNQRAKGGGIW
jgi:hypothetical protein